MAKYTIVAGESTFNLEWYGGEAPVPEPLEQRYALATKEQVAGLDIDAKLREYEDAETEEEKAIRQVYEEIQKGNKLVSLSEMYFSMRSHVQRLPAILAVPSTATKASVLAKRTSRGKKIVELRAGKYYRELPATTCEWEWTTRQGNMIKAETLGGETYVPPVPLRIRKENDVSDTLTMFEVANYQITEEKVTVQRPRDPVLLRQVAGDMYAIVAAWDFTDVEAAVIAALKNK